MKNEKKKKYHRKCFTPNIFPDQRIVDSIIKHSVSVEESLLKMGCSSKEYRHLDVIRLSIPMVIEELFRNNGTMS